VQLLRHGRELGIARGLARDVRDLLGLE
jgi:hypothetical protein